MQNIGPKYYEVAVNYSHPQYIYQLMHFIKYNSQQLLKLPVDGTGMPYEGVTEHINPALIEILCQNSKIH
jgi:hypothetical protein